MNTMYQKRRADLVTWMARKSISVVLLEDTEGRREKAIRYFSGHPGDALLAITVTGHAVLCPWDINLAERMSDVDVIIPYSDFGRHPVTAAAGIIESIGVPANSRIEIPGHTPYPLFLQYVGTLLEHVVLCRETEGVFEEISRMRSIKDESEIAIIESACALTDTIINLLEKQIRSGKIKTELDAAIFIEHTARESGADGTGFETLAAGSDRSYSIHPVPAYTNAKIGTTGLSILDFGIMIGGYTSDVTLTLACGKINPTQEKLIGLVEKAYATAILKYTPGTLTREASLAADAVFKRSKKSMPHALGHGIGLEPHEGPAIRNRIENEWVFEPGMVVTLEPGLYDPLHGGCRLENDILITEEGNRVLTNSRIIRI